MMMLAVDSNSSVRSSSHGCCCQYLRASASVDHQKKGVFFVIRRASQTYPRSLRFALAAHSLRTISVDLEANPAASHSITLPAALLHLTTLPTCCGTSPRLLRRQEGQASRCALPCSPQQRAHSARGGVDGAQGAVAAICH